MAINNWKPSETANTRQLTADSRYERNEMTSAFAPGNISCVFKVIRHADATRMHSLGMGFTVTEGVEATVSEHHETELLFNGQGINFPTVRAVVNRLTQNTGVAGIKVNLTSPLPLGCGFGLSGAAALATAYALNELLHLRKDTEPLAMIAHVAEVENRTGLGDVCSQYHGGCLVKLKEGAPLVADRLPIAETTYLLSLLRTYSDKRGARKQRTDPSYQSRRRYCIERFANAYPRQCRDPGMRGSGVPTRYWGGV